MPTIPLLNCYDAPRRDFWNRRSPASLVLDDCVLKKLREDQPYSLTATTRMLVCLLAVSTLYGSEQDDEPPDDGLPGNCEGREYKSASRE